MEPLEETLTPSELMIETIASIKALCAAIDASINEAGRLADWCSGDDATDTSGVHGLQMCYDRLTEAKMWAGQALGELEGQ